MWAIGAGDPAKPDEIQAAIHWIRHNVSQLYGEKVGQQIHVLYGASVEPEFVPGILSLEGVDGLLVGGASLNPYKFAGIIDAAYRLRLDRGDEA